jgi:hypothetical protein
LMQGWAVFSLVKLEQVSAPTTLGATAANLQPLRLPIDPGTLIPMNEPGDAAALFRQALTELRRSPKAYDNFLTSTKASDIARLDALKPLLKATHLKTGPILSTDFKSVVVYAESKPAIEEAKTLGECLLRAGLLLKQSNAAESKKYYAAAFTLGARLFEDRLVFQQVLVAVGMMNTASIGLADLSPDDAARFEEFQLQTREYYKSIEERLWIPIKTSHGPTISKHAGDIFAFATQSQDKMWRNEAILKLGRLRYNIGEAGRVGDQRGAIRLLKKLATDADPMIRHVAELALNLDRDTFHSIK